jgi:hypothetical protein
MVYPRRLVRWVERLAGVADADGNVYLGGYQGWGGATWPLARVTIDDGGVKVAPTWRWIALVGMATHEFGWHEVATVDLLVGPLGTAHGLRFVLKHRLRNARRWGIAYQSLFVKGVRVFLLPDDLDDAVAAVPAVIPRGRRRGFMIWP